jgi:hypothetical protein
VTPRELIDWGPVRCLSDLGREVIHEGIVIATTIDAVLVRSAAGEMRWFKTVDVEPAGGGTNG